jgi:hypothetical protein
MRKAAFAEYTAEIEPYLRFGAVNAYAVKAARRHLDEKLAEARALEPAWQARFHPVDTKGNVFFVSTRRPPIRRKRRQSPDGYANIKFPENRGKFTKAAKALRAELRAQLGMAKVMRKARKK